MNREWISTSTLRRIALAGVIGSAGMWASGAANNAGDLAAPAATRVYSVVNLGPEADMAALLNERGQVAFGSVNYDGLQTSFFDGERIHPIAGLGGSSRWIRSLNNNGVVVGESLSNAYPNRRILAFSWTLASGPRELAGQSVASANDINDTGVIVGRTGAPGISGRAARWNADGSLIPLGPLPVALSEAYEVNGDGNAAGYTSYAGAAFRASLWAPDGSLTDLGTLGGDYAFGVHINARGDVAGSAQASGRDRNLGFFWSSGTGMLPIDIRSGGVLSVAQLNDKGEVAIGAAVAQRRTAWLWSGQHGAVQLPMGDAVQSDVGDLNNHTELVGGIELQGEDGAMRAVRWPGVNPPIDLNTRLHRPPAGLVLQTGVAINDRGTILAESNAGLVLLRPGTRGTDAPVLGPIRGLPDVVEVGQQLDLTLGFVDNAADQTHTAAAGFADGCASTAPVVSESGGVGEVRLQHTFCKAGLYSVRVQLSDSGGRSTAVQRDVVVDPAGLGSVSGKGILQPAAQMGAAAPAGAKHLPLHFALWAPVGTRQTAPAMQSATVQSRTGGPTVRLHGPFSFRSDQVATAVAAGAAVRLEGTGYLNGQPGYRFLIEALDRDVRAGVSGGVQAAGGPAGSQTGLHTNTRDRMRVRLTHVDAASGAEITDYDNATSANPDIAQHAAGPLEPAVMEGGIVLRR